MTDSLSLAAHAFACRVLMSVSVETLRLYDIIQIIHLN